WADDKLDNGFFLPASSVPTGYHIVYTEGVPGAAASTEELWVRRPFESVDQTLSGPPPGETLFVSTVSRLGHQVLRAGPTAQATLVNVPVTAAPVDVRLDAVYAAARNAHLLQFRRDDVVAGRRCIVLRSAQSLRNPPLLALATHPSSYVDTCVDETGLILRELVVRDGDLATSRTAVSVAVGRAAGDEGAYAMSGVPTPYDQGGGSITPVTLQSLPPGRTWVLPRPPAGFTLRGRYVVVPPQPRAFKAGPGVSAAAPGGPTSLVVTLEDVYVRGPDVLVVERAVSDVLTASAEEPPGPPRPRSFIDNPRIRQACNWLAAALVFYWVIKRLWPAPNGILVKGAVVGGLYALIALGIALVYRANRIVNFAQGDLGGVPASLAVLLIAVSGWPYLPAMLVGLASGVVLGVFIEFVIIRRFARAPRLILTVATIGIAQLLVFGE